LFLGIIAGSMVSGHIDPGAGSFLSAYVFSWLNTFSVSVGLFTVALCGFLAAVYLIGEAENDADRKGFIRKTRNANIIAALCGAFVFVAAYIDGVPLAEWVFTDPVGLSAVVAATASLVLLWSFIRSGHIILIRVLAAFQATMILLAISYAHFPNVILFRNGSYLSLLEAQAPEKTMASLASALLIGSLFILPCLFYLYYSFQKKSAELPVH
jgi:cytochrome d ubiquinol oxidase subunit II